MKALNISFSYGKDEFVKATREYLKISHYFGLTYILILAAAGICLIWLLANNIYNVLNMVCVFVIAFLLSNILSLYFIRPSLAYKKVKSITDSYDLTFFKDRIAFKSDKASTDFKWKIFKKLYETDEFFYLVQSKSSYTILPKRAFENEAAMELFKKTAGSGNGAMEYIKK